MHTFNGRQLIAQVMDAVPSQFDSLEIGVLLHDPETGRILYANGYAEDIYGYAQEELRGMDVGAFSSELFSQAEAIQRIQAAVDGASQQFEWRNKRPTGELYWVEIRLSDITINDEVYVIALVRDITEYKMTVRHLRVLTRITRHNLRNKLNVISGFLEEFDVDHRDTERQIYDRITRNVKELLDLTQWIDTVKSATRITTPVETCDIAQMVREIGERYQRENEDIRWQVACEEVVVSADPKIKSAIEELVENAVQHNPHDGLEIMLSVTASDADDEQALIRVVDTGQPIPEIEIEPIASGYEPDPLEHGEGIGLWEVQTIIEAHGGRLSVKENSLDRKMIEVALPRAQLQD